MSAPGVACFELTVPGIRCAYRTVSVVERIVMKLPFPSFPWPPSATDFQNFSTLGSMLLGTALVGKSFRPSTTLPLAIESIGLPQMR